jgi:hypothetical protein
MLTRRAFATKLRMPSPVLRTHRSLRSQGGGEEGEEARCADDADRMKESHV